MIPLHTVHNFGSEGYPLYGWLGTMNATMVVICTPILTFLFHKKTHIRRIIYAGILFTIGFGMLGFISFKAAFFMSVSIFTLGEILEAISSTPFIMSHTPASHRARIGSILSIMIGAGYTIGTVVMGNILEYTSFETCWIISGSVVLIATIFMVFLGVYDRKHYSIESKEEELVS
jgi:MFS family permease